MTEPRMQQLDAVRNNRVYIIDADIISRGSPRIVDALEEVARISTLTSLEQVSRMQPP